MVGVELPVEHRCAVVEDEEAAAIARLRRPRVIDATHGPSGHEARLLARSVSPLDGSPVDGGARGTPSYTAWARWWLSPRGAPIRSEPGATPSSVLGAETE